MGFAEMNLSQISSAQMEAEGVTIGTWSIKNVLVPGKRSKLVPESNVDEPQRMLERAQDWSTAEEATLVRKIDRRVLFPACVVWFMAYLDRANLGNVRILQGGTPYSLENALHLTANQFNWAISIGYYPALVGIIPAVLLLKKINAKRFFPICMTLWGAIVMAVAGAKSAAGLYAARVFLGVPEFGIIPGCLFYFTLWYKPSERALRIAVFHSSNALAAACSGFLAIAIDKLNRKGGLDSWQWVFLIEGALPIALAVPLYFIFLTFPEDSTALSARERHIAISRLALDSSRKTDLTWSWASFLGVVSRPSTYAFYVSYLSLCTVAIAQATFLPTILRQFAHFSIIKSNLYSSICTLVTIPLYWIWGLHSDWTRERMWHYIIPVIASVPCYGVWTYVSEHHSKSSINAITLYGMAFLGQLVVLSQPILLTYRSTTLYGAAEQAIGTGLSLTCLALASIVSPHMYETTDGPYYRQGFIGTCALLVTCILAYLLLPALLKMEAVGRKTRTGHAVPLQSFDDMDRSTVPSQGRSDPGLQDIIIRREPEQQTSVKDDAIEVQHHESVIEAV